MSDCNCQGSCSEPSKYPSRCLQTKIEFVLLSDESDNILIDEDDVIISLDTTRTGTISAFEYERTE